MAEPKAIAVLDSITQRIDGMLREIGSVLENSERAADRLANVRNDCIETKGQDRAPYPDNHEGRLLFIEEQATDLLLRVGRLSTHLNQAI